MLQPTADLNDQLAGPPIKGAGPGPGPMVITSDGKTLYALDVGGPARTVTPITAGQPTPAMPPPEHQRKGPREPLDNGRNKRIRSARLRLPSGSATAVAAYRRCLSVWQQSWQHRARQRRPPPLVPPGRQPTAGPVGIHSMTGRMAAAPSVPGEGGDALDREEFTSFYASSFPRLVGQLYAMTGDQAEAQDVVQEAFVRAWARRSKIDRDQAPEAWVRVTA